MDKSVAKRSGKKVFLQEYAPQNELARTIYKLVPASPVMPMHLFGYSSF